MASIATAKQLMPVHNSIESLLEADTVFGLHLIRILCRASKNGIKYRYICKCLILEEPDAKAYPTHLEGTEELRSIEQQVALLMKTHYLSYTSFKEILGDYKYIGYDNICYLLLGLLPEEIAR